MYVSKQAVDIENLLVWVYRDEIDKQAVGGLAGWERLIYLGTNVDESERTSWKLPVALGPPHPDALRIDYAVRQLEDVAVDWAFVRRHLMPDLYRWLELADQVEFTHRAELLSDRTARVVKDRMTTSAMRTSPTALVMMHARSRSRPIWDLGPVTVNRIVGKNGKPVVDGLTPGRRYAHGASCPLQLDPPAPEIAAARFEYLAWRTALVQIADQLASWNLADHVVLRPAAAEMPWVADTEKRSRVLDSLAPVDRKKTYGRRPILAGPRAPRKKLVTTD